MNQPIRSLFVMVVVSASAATPAEKMSLAKSLFKAGKWQQAQQAYEDVLPSLAGHEAAEAWLNVGYCLQRRHKHEAALPALRRVLELKDIDSVHVAAAHLRLGYSLRMVGKGREAIAHLRKAAETKGAPSNTIAEARLYAAWEHRNLNEPQAALDAFRKIETIEGVHANYIATAYLNIGRILQERGEYREAIGVYGQIASLNPVAATNRARARVYVLECEALLAGDTPFHIKPYVSKVSATSATLFWVSQGNVPEGTVVLNDGKSTRPFRPSLSPIANTICRLHTTRLDGLKPQTSYTYRVDCGREVVEGAFRTAPEVDVPVRFCVIGDTQSYAPAFQPLLDRMAGENADFILHVGDITDRGDLWGEWKAGFFDPGWNYLRKSALWPAYGNHDGGPYFPTLFGLQKQYYYSFDYGNCHFVVLDSYAAGSGGVGRERQLQWLGDDLARNEKGWTIVALHVPMVATRRDVRWFGVDDFLPLLEKYEADIVFSGHHPHYRRYRPIGPKGGKPILHVTSGGGGPVGGRVPSPLLAKGIDVNHYCVVDIRGNRLTLTARAIDGSVIDRFELVKNAGRYQDELMRLAVETGQAKKVISLYQELLSDRTFELQLFAESRPAPEKPVKLTLDLSRLPRGPLVTSDFPKEAELVLSSTPGSPWQLPPQTFRLAAGRVDFTVVAPKQFSYTGSQTNPALQLVLQLKIGDRRLEPVTAGVRLQLADAAK